MIVDPPTKTASLLRLRPAALLLFLCAHDPFDLAFVLLCQERIAFPVETVQFATKAMETLESVCVNLSASDARNHGTSGFSLMLTVTKPAIAR